MPRAPLCQWPICCGSSGSERSQIRKPSSGGVSVSPPQPAGMCSSAVIIRPSAICTWIVHVFGGPSIQRTKRGALGSVTSTMLQPLCHSAAT